MLKRGAHEWVGLALLLLAGCQKAPGTAAPPVPAAPATIRPPAVLVDRAAEDTRGWQYVIERDDVRRTSSVAAALFSEPFADRVGARARLHLRVVEGNGRENNGKPAVFLDFGDTLNGCRENVCPITMRTDITPLESLSLISLKSDHVGALARDKGREDIAALLTRAHLVLLEVDVADEGKRVVRFTPADPLRLPLPVVPKS